MAAGHTPYRSRPAWKTSAASSGTETARPQNSSTIATHVGEQMRSRIAATSSIWLRAGTASLMALSVSRSTGGAATSLVDSAMIQFPVRAPAGCSLTRRRARSTGRGAVYMSIAGTRASEAAPSSKPPAPMVVVTTQGVQAPAVNAESSNRKLQGGAPSRLNDGTRYLAPQRGVHVGDSRRAASPEIVTRATSTRPKHAGGIVFATIDGFTPATATKRSVTMIRGAALAIGGMGGELEAIGGWASCARPRHPPCWCRSVSLRRPAGAGRLAFHAGRRLEPLACPRRRGLRARWRLVHPTPPA